MRAKPCKLELVISMARRALLQDNLKRVFMRGREVLVCIKGRLKHDEASAL